MKLSVYHVIHVMAFTTVLAQASQAPKCERYEELSKEEQTSILSTNDRSDDECTAFLILRLGQQEYAPASFDIVNYLDFEWPKWSRQGERVTVQRLPALEDHFPAVGALFALGEGAVPAITELLTGANTTLLARANASETLLVINRRSPAEAVRALVRASHATTDVSASARLLAAAIDTSGRCQTWGEAAGACRAALLQH